MYLLATSRLQTVECFLSAFNEAVNFSSLLLGIQTVTWYVACVRGHQTCLPCH